jgi:hypothetical protein
MWSVGAAHDMENNIRGDNVKCIDFEKIFELMYLRSSYQDLFESIEFPKAGEMRIIESTPSGNSNKFWELVKESQND